MASSWQNVSICGYAMTERFINPISRYFSDVIQTLPGSKLYFYANGSSTPKVVYQDINKVTPHANPVVSDSAGNFPAIFLDGTYRVELKNAAGVTQTGWPLDNIGGAINGSAFDDYSAITTYTIGDIVTGSNGLYYQSQQNGNLNNDPAIVGNRPAWWKEFHLIDEWNPVSTYSTNDRVYYVGSAYISIQNSNTNQTPSSTSAYWKQFNEDGIWNPNVTYASGAISYSAGIRYVSQQAANLNHNPVGDTGTWWRPWWQIGSIIGVVPLSGGGNLTSFYENVINDGSTYTLPAANSVPANGFIVISKGDIAVTLTPTFQRAGADTIAWRSGTDTSVLIDTLWPDTMRLYSNGSNQWSFK